MAIIKYALGENPLNNEHQGFTFQRNNYGHSMFASQKNDRYRKPLQDLRNTCLSKAVRGWRDQDAATITAWENFSSTYPQASRKNPSLFLTAQQLFVKRNYYHFLHCGLRADFITEPALESLSDPNFTFEIKSGPASIDITDNYIKAFGILPQVGQYVLLKAYPMAINSGQFFTPIEQIIQVDEVSIDGLFVNCSYDPGNIGVMISVSLSKVFNQSISYVGTKVRYMGCFSPNTFLQLTDTPDDYTGESGKVVAVKATEDGLEFIAGGGGGLDCDDLINCDIISQLVSQVAQIGAIISEQNFVSIPVINLGLLYNFYAATNVLEISSSSAWRLPTQPEWDALEVYLGDASGIGCSAFLKEATLDFWQTPNTGATNSKEFTARGTGYRLSSGAFGYKNQRTYIMTSTAYSSSYKYRMEYNNANTIATLSSKKEGSTIRLVKSATGISDGVKTSYVGNDGKIYRAVALNQLFWLADNLAETKYRDGSLIPEITDASSWAADLSGALCAYNNDWSNV